MYVCDKSEYNFFVFKFKITGNITDVSKEVFDTRCEEVTAGFISRYMLLLPIIQCDDISGVITDTRSFIDISKSTIISKLV